MTTIEIQKALPKELKTAFTHYIEESHQEPDSVILEAIEQFLLIREEQKQGILEALETEHETGVHFSYENIGAWINTLEKGSNISPTPDV